ncbi:alpha/beta hydrolase [Marivirga lumbricoides]|uniref:Alpha/beta hydrolase n=1 Tax=Marivirga lumbricoides TaxID=1046115 RepID=A0ABQ1N4H1_9BACT|nr:alpha/beta hydrolase [Marivirga lumbricoides]
MKTLKTIILLFILSISTAFAQSKAFKVEVFGKGTPLILIPGYSCSGNVWKETVEQLKADYECHVLTLAGYAGVAPIESPILETVKNEIIQYAKTQKLKKPALIGHSLGAFLSLWVSSESPELFGKIIAVDGVPFISAMYNPEITADSMKNTPQMKPEVVVQNFMSLPEEGFIKNTANAMMYQVSDSTRARQIAEWQYNSERRTLGLTLVEISTTDLRNSLPGISQEVLILGSIYGSKDQSKKILYEQYKKLPSKTIKIADSKHFIMYDQPEWFYNEVKKFLD